MNATTQLPPLSDPDALVKAMAEVHGRLANDLRARSSDPRVEPSLREAHAADRASGRTGDPYDTYRDGFCDQVAASWVLCTVFVRTLEDRGYLDHRVAGPGAGDRFAQFRAQYRFLRERDYLLHVFDAVALLPGGREVFGSAHAPLWRLAPSSRAISELLDTLRGTADGELRFTFGRPAGTEHDGASTRYLGDLYQNLNEAVRKRFALLQTPEFVERFILDNTLDPAIRDRGIGVTLIDPACGSGHLLLGAYDRLFQARRQAEPGNSPELSARRAIEQIHGVDLNPYAAAIARFRLLLSYLDKAALRRLEAVPEALTLHVYVGDSLFAGVHEIQQTFGDDLHRRGVTSATGFAAGPLLSLFDSEADALLSRSRFDVVVANPPYIQQDDEEKSKITRTHYRAASGQYALSAPFVERIFQLGNDGAFTGQITANTFMKRKFGEALIKDVLPNLDLNEVIDAAGAFIPGHEHQATVLLFGRSRRPTSSHVPVVMGIRGEPGLPPKGEEERGKVWSSIASHHREINYADEFISVVEFERAKLARWPWTFGASDAVQLKALLEERAPLRLKALTSAIGRTTVAGEDDIWVARPGHWRRQRL